MDSLTVEAAAKLKVDELKAALKDRGLSTTGKKQELYERLAGHLREINDAVPVAAVSNNAEDENAIGGVEQPIPSTIVVIAGSTDEAISHTVGDTETPESVAPSTEKQVADEPTNLTENAILISSAVQEKEEEVVVNDQTLVSEDKGSIPNAGIVSVDEPSGLADETKETPVKDKIEPSSSILDSEISTKYFHVRIDNFKRPLKKPELKDWLEALCGHKIADDSLWLNDFKSHCYIDFATSEQADACIAAVVGKVIDPRQKDAKPLEADLTSVSATEAAAGAPEAKLKPGEWKKLTSAIAPVGSGGKKKGAAAVAVAASEAAAAAARTFSITLGGSPSAVPIRTAAAVPAAPLAASTTVATVAGNGTAGRIIGNEIIGFSTRRNRGEMESGSNTTAATTATGEPTAKRNRVEQRLQQRVVEEEEEEHVVSLEDIFKKTKHAVPPLYWLPVSDDIVATRLKARLQATKKH